MIAPPTTVATVAAFIGHLSARQWDQLPAYFTSDAQWWTSGNPEHVAMAGWTSAADHLPLLSGLGDMFDAYSFDIVNMVGAENRVMLEGQARGTGPEDLVYVNNITMAFTLNDNAKFTTLREYPEHVEINWLLEWFANHTTAASA